MKIVVPDYYKEFHCIADKCKHTCCKGWEIDIDEKSLERFQKYPEIMQHVDIPNNCFRLGEDEACPFLREDGLCQQIVDHGEDFLCQICTDHPRFRNFWSDRVELGLGLVCEEAARIILFREKPMKLMLLEEEREEEEIDHRIIRIEEEKEDALAIDKLPPDERALMEYRQRQLEAIEGNDPGARLLEYLIYRHLADALYDNRLPERMEFIYDSYDKIMEAWDKTDGSKEAMIDVVLQFSYDEEYNE